MTGLVARARWFVEDYATAAGLQLAGMASRSDPADYQTGSGRPCIVIPGVYETWHFMAPVIEALHGRGHPVFVIEALRHNRRPVIDSAAVVADFVRQHGLGDVFIAAHSKGGLIGKYAMLELDPDSRFVRMVAIATPFSGSRYADFAPNRTLRAFRANDPLTVLLNKEDRVNDRITSVFGEYDPIIPESSVLPGAENVKVRVGGHFRVLRHPTTLAVTVEAAARP
ncbi:alpha/beta hydrolase [Herbiconiux sp. VKM Ac-1786]|jgi:pimeloyl-ACP methyl ester carboxylesterase|uniref:alpha/beta hydrolase n=1 Tax=Herbiconiux sp. VKM Ac-1786 TaxID=2783824 RepID=UPI00188A2863|nr:alpha/beta hydrolase [Herbiconiux sp. VKM Ac-1786]MBF4573885.1 alpha/beta hydrolase [Herbiconiux sp. VKM Ac-1786]